MFEQPGPDANCLFRQLNWKDSSTQFQIQKALMVYKSLNDLVPGYLSSKLVEQYETCYSLRDSVNKPIFIVPFPQTNFMNNSFSYSRAVFWNSLPYDMREAKSLNQFKQLAHLNFWRIKNFSFFLFFLNHRGSFYGGGGMGQNSPLPHLLCAYTCTQHLEKLPLLYSICYSTEFLRVQKI